MRFTARAAGWLLVSIFLIPRPGDSCDRFCDAIGQTVSQDLKDAVAVIAVRPLSRNADKTNVEIVRRYKSNEQLGFADQVELAVSGTLRKGKLYLLCGFGTPRIGWKTPLEIDEAALTYFAKLDQAPAEGSERLAFFLPYLDASSKAVVDDAYNEFAIAPYADVQKLQSHLDRSHLVSRLRDTQLSARLRRLYFALLCVVGTADDAEFVAAELKKRGEKPEPMLDAAIACYLSIQGEAGLSFIEQEFLAQPKVVELPAVVRAMRFHGDDETKIPPQRLAQSLRQLLKSPETAESIIVDLARWKDWGALDRVVGQLEGKGADSASLRSRVIEFLMVCPTKEAKSELNRLEKVFPRDVEFVRLRNQIPVPSADDDSVSDSNDN